VRERTGRREGLRKKETMLTTARKGAGGEGERREDREVGRIRNARETSDKEK
jgi:hypothetical protein